MSEESSSGRTLRWIGWATPMLLAIGIFAATLGMGRKEPLR